METEPTERRELRHYLRILWEGRYLVLVSTVLALVAAVAYTQSVTPEYDATSRVLVQDNDPTLSGVGGGGGGYEDPDVRAATVLDLATLPALADRVVTDLNLDAPPEAVLERVEADIRPNSRLLTLTATHTDPQGAAALANSFADAFVDFRRDTTRRRLTATLDGLRAQLEDAEEQGGAASQGEVQELRNQIATLEAQAATLAGDSEVIQTASVPDSPARPNPLRNYLLGGLFGLIPGLGLAFLRSRLDRRIKDEAELRALLGDMPVLASVPAAGNRDRELMLASEAFRTLQANLTFLDVDRPLRSVLITGGGSQEGKAATSLNLALAMEERRQSVMLIDANLRERSLSRSLYFGDRPGVSNFLTAGDDDIMRYVREVTLEGADSNGTNALLAGSVSVVPAGPVPPNPGSLMNTTSLDALLDQVTGARDRAIIAGGPLGTYSEMLPIARRVDGVVLVARLNHTTRDNIRNMLRLLRQAGVRALGVVIFEERALVHHAPRRRSEAHEHRADFESSARVIPAHRASRR